MKILLTAISCICLTAGVVVFGQERGWRGLVPLHSGRADVERVLGHPAEMLGKRGAFYRTPDETIVISYSTGLPCGIGEKYSQWRVPADTVQSILVTPIKQLRFSQLGIDENKYKRGSGGHRQDDVHYINDQEGTTITVFMGNVTSISLYPGSVDEHLGCFPSPPAVKCEGLTPTPIDSYGNISLEQERTRLDNLAVVLLHQPDASGYIIAYAGKSARVGEAKEWAERAKRYLVRVRNLSANRIKTIDGGFREERVVEIYVVPDKICPPVPDPTIDPRDVQITRPRKQKGARPSLPRLQLRREQIGLRRHL